MASLQGLQFKADIVSAFSTVFGLDIAHTKLQTILHLPDGIIQRSAPLIIYTTGWTPQSISVGTKGVLKALGNKYDISSGKLHDTQFEESRLRVIRFCNILERAKGDPANKTFVLRCCVGGATSKLFYHHTISKLISQELINGIALLFVDIFPLYPK